MKRFIIKNAKYISGIVFTLICNHFLPNFISTSVVKDILNMVISVYGNILSVTIALLAIAIIFKSTIFGDFIKQYLLHPGIECLLGLVIASLAYIISINNSQEVSKYFILINTYWFFYVIGSVFNLLLSITVSIDVLLKSTSEEKAKGLRNVVDYLTNDKDQQT